MSLWELGHIFQGWAEANGAEPPVPAPTEEEFDELVAKFAHV